MRAAHRGRADERLWLAGRDAHREPAGPYRIGDDEFRRFQDLVQGETGIQLPESKRALLVGRLARRLRELKLASFGDYYRRVTDPNDAAERIRMIDRICTNETYFFREPRQFEFLEREVLSGVDGGRARDGSRRVRVWSAACATGEEPYSIAMTLLVPPPRMGDRGVRQRPLHAVRWSSARAARLARSRSPVRSPSAT